MDSHCSKVRKLLKDRSTLKNRFPLFALTLFLLSFGMLMQGCGQDFSHLFSRLPKTQVFLPDGTSTWVFRLPSVINIPVDVLWVMDDSQESIPLVPSVKQGVKAFADRYFHHYNNFQMAVIGTHFYQVADPDAYQPGEVTIYRTTPPLGEDASEWNKNQKELFNAQIGAQTNRDESARVQQSIVRFLALNEDRDNCRASPPDSSCLFRQRSLRVFAITTPHCDRSRWECEGSCTEAKYAYIRKADLNNPFLDIPIPGQTFFYPSSWAGALGVWQYQRSVLDRLDNLSVPDPNYFMKVISVPYGEGGCSPGTTPYDLTMMLEVNTIGTQYSSLVGQETNSKVHLSSFHNIRASSYDAFLADFSKDLDSEMITLSDLPAFPLTNLPSERFEVKLVATTSTGETLTVPSHAYRIVDGLLYVTDSQTIADLTGFESLKISYVPKSSIE